MSKHDHFTRDELARLLEARDRRDATRFGLVWEANEIEGRKTEDSVLLADPKLNYQRDDEALKILAEHQVYGHVFILFREGGIRWMTVGYDEKIKKPCLVREFRLSDMAGF